MSLRMWNCFKKISNSSKIVTRKLALKCDLDRTYIGILERGERRSTISTLFIISKNLTIPPSNFIEEIEQLLENTTIDN